MIAAQHDNEKDLLLQVANGSELAFRQLFDAYWNKIFQVARMLSKSNVLAEELVQDIFLKIWLNRRDLATVGKFDGYLFTIARNHIYNELRKKTREQAFVEHLEQHFLESYSLPEQLLILKETTELIHQAVEILPEQQRAVYKLSRNEGLDYNTIAEKLGISRSTVKNHMTQALKTLRLYLSNHAGELVLAAILIKEIK